MEITVSKIIEEQIEVPSYIEGETFVFNIPYNIQTLDCKISPKPEFYGDDPWSPWPDVKGIERRMGSWMLKLHDSAETERGLGKNSKKRPLKLIRRIGDEPNTWLAWMSSWTPKDEVIADDANLKAFNGRHVLSVFEEDYPELFSLPDVPWAQRQSCPKHQKLQELRKPKEISKEILNKVYGRSHPRIESYSSNFEFTDRRNQFQLDLEWYRKELLKIQRKINNKKKKKLAEELGVAVADIEAQKREEQEIAKSAQFTQEWIEISGEVFKTIDFLNDVVKQIGQHRNGLDREWFDQGRRTMRDLANTMRPLNKHFPKNK